MASNDSNYPPNSADNMSRNRRSSVTSATLSSIFRSNSISNPISGTPAYPGPITSAAMDQNRRRRLSVSTTAALGLSGASAGNGSVSAGPNGGIGSSSFAARRASMSTNSSTSDSAFDENAIEDDDAPPGNGSRNSPNAPFARRMSFGAQAMRNLRGPGTSPGGASSNDQGYNWPEQLRSRAESSVASGARPSFSFASGMGNSPPRGSGFGSMSGFASGGSSGIPGGAGGGVGSGGGVGMRHDRAKSVSDMPAPPPAQQRPAPQPRQAPRPKPDHFQERILKGDFYMD